MLGKLFFFWGSHNNFTLKHVLGKSMEKIDELSQRPDWQKEAENNNENQIQIKPEWIKQIKTLVKENNLREKIKKMQGKNKKVVKAVEKLKKVGIKTLRDEKWTVEEGLVIKEKQVYVPEEELREEMIYLHHDMLVEGHGRRWKTTELITRNYWWLGVTKEVERYIERYDTCQQYKNRNKAPAGKLMSNVIPEKQQSHILADFITKLPLA